MVESIIDFINRKKAILEAKKKARRERQMAMVFKNEKTLLEAKQKLKSTADEVSSLLLDSRYPHFIEFMDSLVKIAQEGLENSLRHASSVENLIEAAKYQAVIDFAKNLRFYPEKILKQAEKIKEEA